MGVNEKEKQKMGKHIMLLLILTLLSCGKESNFEKESDSQEINYTVIAHSHNDYEQEFPISTALACGFNSIEVDIVFDGDKIKVSHDEKNLEEKPEFEEFYLAPLIESLANEEREIILLVDIKNYSENLLTNLNVILKRHEQNLVSRNIKDKGIGKIKVLLSGDIPRREILMDETNEYLFIDGRISDLENNFDSHLMPLISMDFTNLTKWKGILKPNKNTIENITKTVNSVHKQKKLIRFWKTNDRASIWLNLIDLEVDIIGVDDIESFYEVMKKNNLIE